MRIQYKKYGISLVMMIPKDLQNPARPAFILEFKVRNLGKEASLEETTPPARTYSGTLTVIFRSLTGTVQ